MYEEFLKYKYLQPVTIENKEYYYKLIHEISDSFTSKLIGNFFHSANINLIIEELGQLLANSIELYEWGYFDNAYYSLRSANELATIMLDLSDKDDWAINKNMELFLTKRYNKKRFKIIEWLSDESIVFKEIIDKIPSFKDEINTLLNEINQVIHMSGRENLYVFRKNLDENFHKAKLNEFEKHFLATIKILAIFRLIIDPFPLLLKDEEIYFRWPDVMTAPFSNDLLSVIGEKSISEFEQIESVKSLKNQILKMEKRNPAVNEFVLCNVIDMNHINDIYSQKHLLDEFQLIFLDIASCSDKITEIKSSNYFDWCITTSKSSDYICNVLNEERLREVNHNFNNNYDEIFVSILGPLKNLEGYSKSELIYIFHEEKLDDDEIDKLKKLVDTFDRRNDGN